MTIDNVTEKNRMGAAWIVPPDMKRRAAATRRHLQNIDDAESANKESATLKLRHAIKVGSALIADQDQLTELREQAAKERHAARQRGVTLENHPLSWEQWLENLRDIRASNGGQDARNSRILSTSNASRYMLLARNAKLAKVVARGRGAFSLVDTCKAISNATPEQLKKANALEIRKEQHRKKFDGTTAKVALADCQEFMANIKDGSVDLLLTDPPYETDVADIYEFARGWIHPALNKLNATGRAFIFIGAYPREMHAYLGELLSRRDLITDPPLVWTYRNTLGPTPVKSYKQNWQAILHVRRPDAPELSCSSMVERFSVQDVNAPDGRQGDRYHAWQKPDALADRLVRHAVGDNSGAVMIDPFCCTGTFLLSAAARGCVATGCDIDQKNIAIAKERGCIDEL